MSYQAKQLFQWLGFMFICFFVIVSARMYGIEYSDTQYKFYFLIGLTLLALLYKRIIKNWFGDLDALATKELEEQRANMNSPKANQQAKSGITFVVLFIGYAFGIGAILQLAPLFIPSDKVHLVVICYLFVGLAGLLFAVKRKNKTTS